MFKAKILCDSTNVEDNRLITFELTFPRMILAEFNTHKSLCLAGDTILEFDLPRSNKIGRSHIHKMTIKEFYEKWHFGAKQHICGSVVDFDLSKIDKSKCYSAKDLATLCGMASASNIRTWCRNNRLKYQNCTKKRSDDFIIKGSDFIHFMSIRGTRTFPMKDRLSKMRIRQINENTKEIQHSNVVDCFKSERKEIFKLELEDGKFVKASADHLIFTNNGWMKLKELNIGDLVYVKKNSTLYPKDPIRYKKINGQWTTTWSRKNKNIVFARQNNLCNFCKIKSPRDIHHVIPVHKNIDLAFEISNVEGLCLGCHKKKHSKDNHQNNNKLIGTLSKVKSIERVGIEETYDLSIGGEFPNFVANEIIVHNCRNAASSRAIPVEKMIRQVMDSPFIPIYWGKAQKGMQAYEEVSPENMEKCKTIWLKQRDIAVKAAEEMLALGLHKQIPNRLLENWMWCTVIATGNARSWNNFWNLRNHHAAEPHMQIIAKMSEIAAQESYPTILAEGQWHLPLIGFDGDSELPDFDKPKVSVGRCARVSYLTHDGKRDTQADIRLHDTLQKDGHFSPFEHVAMALNTSKRELSHLNGSLGIGWAQYRKTLNGEFQDKRS